MRLLTASIFLVAIATAGCKNTGVKSISGLETERISRFIDSKNSLGQEIHASPIDLVREQLTWESEGFFVGPSSHRLCQEGNEPQ